MVRRLRGVFSSGREFRSIAGFLICMAPEAPYRSPNFLWLLERYRDFSTLTALPSRHSSVAAGLLEPCIATPLRPPRLAIRCSPARSICVLGILGRYDSTNSTDSSRSDAGSRRCRSPVHDQTLAPLTGSGTESEGAPRSRGHAI